MAMQELRASSDCCVTLAVSGSSVCGTHISGSFFLKKKILSAVSPVCTAVKRRLKTLTSNQHFSFPTGKNLFLLSMPQKKRDLIEGGREKGPSRDFTPVIWRVCSDLVCTAVTRRRKKLGHFLALRSVS